MTLTVSHTKARTNPQTGNPVPVVSKRKGQRKQYIAYNRFKNGKYVDLPTHCNECLFRAKEDGGLGKCSQYEKDSVCVLREDIKRIVKECDTRNPDDLKRISNENVMLLRERALMAMAVDAMTGIPISKETTSLMDTMLKYLRFAKELNGSLKVTEVSETAQMSGEIERLFRQVKVNG